MWSDIYLLRASSWLDHNHNLNPNPNPNRNPNPSSNKGKRKMCWLKFVFKSYFEADDDGWDERGCISEECASFVSENILWQRWQAGTKMTLYV